MWACGGVMGGVANRGKNCSGFKTRSGVWPWVCVFCVKAVWGGGGYMVVGRL